MNPEDDGARKRKRGPYKQYLDVSKGLQVPRSTLFSRKKAIEAQNQLENENRDDMRVGGGEEVPDIDLPHENEVGGEMLNEENDDEQFHEANDLLQPDAEHEIEEPLEEIENDDGEEHQEPQQKGSDYYIKKHKLNDKLHGSSPVSRLDCLLMILHLSARHANTQKFVEDAIQFVNTMFGSSVLDVSYHIYQKIFPSSKSIVRHFFCDVCEIYVGCDSDYPKDVVSAKCRECGKDIDVKSVYSKNYFVTLSIKEQIEDLLKRPHIKFVELEDRDPNIIADVFDGEHFKKCRQPAGVFNRRNFFTATFNTDGVQVYDCVHDSMYPFFMHLNEIVPEDRFKTENLILGGLWFGKSAPNMAYFLKPILSQLMELSVNGVSVTQPNGVVIQVPVFPLYCSVDSVAKPKIVCQTQFNGAFSCLYCYHPNDAVADEANSHLKYFETSVAYPLRQEIEVIRDMNEADELERRNELRKSSVNGFRGLSVLLLFMKFCEHFPCSPFNIVWGVVIDYLHALLEGVASTLLGHYKGMLTAAQLDSLNNRLDQIKLPQGMSRKPRRLDAKIKYKAKEYRSFFLYFAVPCFEDLLPARHFANLKLFVNALHIYLGDKITLRALHQAKLDMENFCRGFQRLFGLQSVTYNLHLCFHIFDLVLRNGPLWAYSNFIFESGNGLLSRLVRGTRTVVNEVAIKYTRVQSAVKCMLDQPISNEALKFCNEILNTKIKKSFRVDNLSVSSISFVQITDEERIMFQQNKVIVDSQRVRVYNKAIRNGLIYCSLDTVKAVVTNDSCVQVIGGGYAFIKKILLTEDDKLVCLVQSLRLAQDHFPLPSVIMRCAHDVFGDLSIIPFKDISRKCVFISFDQKHFVCNMPNLYERD